MAGHIADNTLAKVPRISGYLSQCVDCPILGTLASVLTAQARRRLLSYVCYLILSYAGDGGSLACHSGAKYYIGK